jgi:hypothetical protein
MNELPTQEYLNECISYDINTGECFWKHRDISHFKSESSYKMWNTRFSGKIIEGVDKSGKICLNLDNKQYALHRLIFKMNYGGDPSKYLKHKDNNVTNNKLENLYEDTVTTSGGNRNTPKHNTSGLTGASYKAIHKKWESEITYKGIRYYLGRFDTAEEAHAAYLKASDELKAGTYDKV